MFFTAGGVFYPFLSIFSARCHLLGGGAQACPEVGELERDGTSYEQHGAATAASHRSHPAAPSARVPAPNPYLYNPGNPHPIYI